VERPGIERFAAASLVGLVSIAELPVFERMLFDPRHPDYAFVLRNVDGILAGTPVSQSWQQRVLGPCAIAALRALVPSSLGALELFFALSLLGANAFLCAIVWKRTRSVWHCGVALLAFGTCRLLLLYRLEYPWDEIDIAIFLGFGAWAGRDGALSRFSPWLLPGILNHETVLYIPFYYLLPRLENRAGESRRRGDFVFAAACLAACAGAIHALRAVLYRGRPQWPGQAFEPALPGFGNHFHLGHNLHQLFRDDFRTGHTLNALGMMSAVVALCALLLRRHHPRAALFSLCVIASVLCFGYVNETRHYLPLLAFWFAYAWPAASVGRKTLSAIETRGSQVT
jgi:hypothetical protein